MLLIIDYTKVVGKFQEKFSGTTVVLGLESLKQDIHNMVWFMEIPIRKFILNPKKHSNIFCNIILFKFLIPTPKTIIITSDYLQISCKVSLSANHRTTTEHS